MKYSFLSFYFLERMCGHIDQIDSVVHFERRQMLDNWDKQIQSLCHQVLLILTFLLLSQFFSEGEQRH